MPGVAGPGDGNGVRAAEGLPRIRRFFRERPRPIAAILTGFSHNTGNLAQSRENPFPSPRAAPAPRGISPAPRRPGRAGIAAPSGSRLRSAASPSRGPRARRPARRVSARRREGRFSRGKAGGRERACRTRPRGARGAHAAGAAEAGVRPPADTVLPHSGARSPALGGSASLPYLACKTTLCLKTLRRVSVSLKSLPGIALRQVNNKKFVFRPRLTIVLSSLALGLQSHTQPGGSGKMEVAGWRFCFRRPGRRHELERRRRVHRAVARRGTNPARQPWRPRRGFLRLERAEFAAAGPGFLARALPTAANVVVVNGFFFYTQT